MRIIYNGIVYDIKSVQFDLVGQRYCAYIRQYRFLNFWRRESNRIGIESCDIWIYINPNTPHIAKMAHEGKQPDDICHEISLYIRNYIDYAFNRVNIAWVGYISGDISIVEDKMELLEAINKIGLKPDDRSLLEIFKAY